jgi:GPH family glycoside/pentoside/hexuronide:cation symporter
MSAPLLSRVHSPATPKSPLPLWLQLFYGIGEIPITLTMGLMGIFVLFFYNSVMGLPAVLAGFGVTAGLVVDAMLDPYIGYRSDQCGHKLGRRHAFMLFGALAMGPCFCLLMSPPRNLGTIPLFCWLLVCSVAFRFTMAVYRIPYLSLGAELTSDYDERTRVIAIRSLLGLAGMLAGSALPFLLFFPAVSGDSDPKLHYGGYPRMGLFFGACMTLAGLAAMFGTLSRRTSGDTKKAHPEARRFSSGVRMFLRNREFRALWVSFTICSLAVVVNFSLAVHYLKWYARIDSGKALSAIQTCFYVGALAGVVAWIWIAKRGEKRNLFAGSTLGLAALLCMAALLVGEGRLFGTGHPLPLMAGNFIAGLLASALWVLPFSMMADVVDEDELHSGMRREGICFGVMNFGEKVAAGGALLVSGALLSFFIHLKPGGDAQAPGVVDRVGLAYGLAPGILLALSACVALSYGLDRRKVRSIQARLAEQRGKLEAPEG